MSKENNSQRTTAPLSRDIGKYIIISPARNEGKYIEKTIESVLSQSILPSEWIIIDDGSSDNTGEIVKRHAKDCGWIKLINKKNRGFTEVGRGVVEAFYTGYSNIRNDDWDFIVKLDCDVELEKEYFERLIETLDSNAKLGITGGTPYTMENDAFLEEEMPDFHPWAGARMYRKECFKEIGGLKETLGWDTIDLLRAHMTGWETKRITDLKINHLRRMSSRKGLWEGKIRTGRNFYITGYHPLFLFARCVYHLAQRPYFIESFGVVAGYLMAMSKNEPLVVTLEEKKYLRNQQIKRLLGFNIAPGNISVQK